MPFGLMAMPGRSINGYVPLFGNPNEWEKARYQDVGEPVHGRYHDEPKTFEFYRL